MDLKLLDVVACPACKGKLIYDSDHDELHCRFDRLAFSVVDNIPVLVVEKAHQMND